MQRCTNALSSVSFVISYRKVLLNKPLSRALPCDSEGRISVDALNDFSFIYSHSEPAAPLP